MLNWLIFGYFQKCDEPSGDVGFNFESNVFSIRYLRNISVAICIKFRQICVGGA